ncbi:stalk domain-containing protein [Crassaminicella indica]|uniref:Copper amine oxidase N-terminal domain-containing protein n=1 Tax=Crassaminicella indica TaxID=2855394 RepID=A0ABX8RCI2_9CLOT|nr:stalk domain-containing protein [Crassaminicella indica]QXM06758.1 copper amine oxidase N-terminal domain-containing protein [Crassaminicella indica]
MKKKNVLSLALVLVFVVGTVLGTAAGYSEKITAWFYDIHINLDGKPLGFYSRPFIYNGQVYVSINDIANNMGFGIQWDDKNKTMNLSSNDNNRFSINTLQHELDQKNIEIANLKFQLSQKKVELDILRDNRTTSSSTRKSLNDLEKKLEDDYDYHRNNGRTLNFDNYDVSQLSNDKIRVCMYGDFDRTSRHWKDRDKSDFEDFIEKICERIDREYNDDIEVIVYDEDNDKTAEYTYDVSRDRLSEEYVYGSSSSDDLDDLEDDLERHFDDHTNNGKTMRFDRYDLTEYSDEIRVKIYSDFDRKDSIWKNRDKSDFRDFIEDICGRIDKDYNKDIKVYVYDKDDDDLAKYTYDDGDNEIKNTYDWEY